ncbi:MAG: hypothetical protein ACREJ2_13095 [Planctomycetota bacterium]
MNSEDILKAIDAEFQALYKAESWILGFDEFLNLFMHQPYTVGRNAAQVLVDAIDHFGKYEVQAPGGTLTRYRIFDAERDDGRNRLCGQEQAAYNLIRHLRIFAESKVDKLILLHGPNGSSKSTLVKLLARALERYTGLPEGHTYTFRFLFEGRNTEERLGFARGSASGKGASIKPAEKTGGFNSLAHEPEDRIAFKIESVMREHPLLLLPRDHRRHVIDAALQAAKKAGRYKPHFERVKSPYLWDGELSGRSHQIVDALLKSYEGNLSKVLAHVQVVRWTASRRYREGIVTIEPQQSVDAGVRVMDLDMGSDIPPALQGMRLIDIVGELADGAGGLVEYTDIFKRPMEMNKYLLQTIEEGMVSLPSALQPLNAVLIASANEKYLEAFKKAPDFPSYKGRVELVMVPYLLQWRTEMLIYQDYVRSLNISCAPHTLETAAQLAVLTRLRRPDPDHYAAGLKNAIDSLSPFEKMMLYDAGATPQRLSSEEARLLVTSREGLYHEFDNDYISFEGFEGAAFEGRFGLSAREIRMILADAYQATLGRLVTPKDVLDRFAEMLKHKSVYLFLQVEPQGKYFDHMANLREVRRRWLQAVLDELFRASGLVKPGEFERVLENYIGHVRAHVSGAKYKNPQTGALEPPNKKVFERVEQQLGVKEDSDSYRRSLLQRAAAWKLDHPESELVVPAVFPDLIKQLRVASLQAQFAILEPALRGILVLEDPAAFNSLPEAPRILARTTYDAMLRDFQYDGYAARQVASLVLSEGPDLLKSLVE